MWNKLTPVYVVDWIEPCVEFWTKRFGFVKSIEVPEGDHLGFVALQRDNVEIMYQSRTSLINDIKDLGHYPLEDSSIGYIEVGALEEVEDKLEGVEIVVPRRRTFYGSVEIGIRGPGGRIVIFSAPGEQASAIVPNPLSTAT